MAKGTSKKSAKVAKNAARRVAAKAVESRKEVAKSSARKPTKAATPKLLSGGNPQIGKADGDVPVQALDMPCGAVAPTQRVGKRRAFAACQGQAYIAAIPGWKKGVGRRHALARVVSETATVLPHGAG